jgi:uncharacterized alkaline shock family protein YloU
MSDQLVLTEAEGTITVPAATLSQLVVDAAERVEGARVRRPRRSVDVDVAGDGATVSVRLTASYGAVLPDLAEAVQRQIAAAFEEMCGLTARSIDVTIEELVEA